MTDEPDWLIIHQGTAPLIPLAATIVQNTLSRTMNYVNRPPDGASVYPGHATTDLCPLTILDGETLYPPGQHLC